MQGEWVVLEAEVEAESEVVVELEAGPQMVADSDEQVEEQGEM